MKKGFLKRRKHFWSDEIHHVATEWNYQLLKNNFLTIRADSTLFHPKIGLIKFLRSTTFAMSSEKHLLSCLKMHLNTMLWLNSCIYICRSFECYIWHNWPSDVFQFENCSIFQLRWESTGSKTRKQMLSHTFTKSLKTTDHHYVPNAYAHLLLQRSLGQTHLDNETITTTI